MRHKTGLNLYAGWLFGFALIWITEVGKAMHSDENRTVLRGFTVADQSGHTVYCMNEYNMVMLSHKSMPNIS